MDFLKALWALAFTSTPLPPLWLTALAVAFGSAVVAAPALWHGTRHVVTLAHEAGHAVTGVLVGRKLNGIKLHTDTSGVTTTSGVGWGISGMLTTFAGYPAPAAVSGIILLGMFTGHTNMTAILLAIVLTGLLLFTRNMWGILVTATTILTLGITVWFAPTIATQGLLLTLSATLALGGYRTLLEERRGRKDGRGGSDISTLAHNTVIPAAAWWAAAFTVATAWITIPVYLLF